MHQLSYGRLNMLKKVKNNFSIFSFEQEKELIFRENSEKVQFLFSFDAW